MHVPYRSPFVYESDESDEDYPKDNYDRGYEDGYRVGVDRTYKTAALIVILYVIRNIITGSPYVTF
jgi:hypothetical protein